MIVTNVEAGWEIVFQPAHGVLAGALALEFADEWKSRFWVETVAAIIGHDDQKEDFEQNNYITEVGAPKDFTLMEMQDKKRFEEASERIKNAYRKHTWIGLLQGKHTEFLYDDQDVDDRLRELIEHEKERRKDKLRKLKLKLSDLEQAYNVVRWCDRCSLILSRNTIPAMGRELEIITTPNHEQFMITQNKEEDVNVSPWPFARSEFDIHLEVHLVRELQFDNDRQLAEALEECERFQRKWTFKKP